MYIYIYIHITIPNQAKIHQFAGSAGKLTGCKQNTGFGNSDQKKMEPSNLSNQRSLLPNTSNHMPLRFPEKATKTQPKQDAFFNVFIKFP